MACSPDGIVMSTARKVAAPTNTSVILSVVPLTHIVTMATSKITSAASLSQYGEHCHNNTLISFSFHCTSARLHRQPCRGIKGPPLGYKGIAPGTMRTGISATDDAMARDIVAKNGYAKFLENKKLMTAWLAHVPAGPKPADVPNDEWIPFLHFLRKSCYNTMFDVAYDWMGHDAFVRVVHGLIDMGAVHQHEMLYMAKNCMIDPRIYAARYGHASMHVDAAGSLH